MIEKFGRKGTESAGIFFTEGEIQGVILIKVIEHSSNQQNVSLDILKEQMAIKARQLGGVAVDNFKYVQKGTVFSFSSTRWVLTGRVVRVGE